MVEVKFTKYQANPVLSPLASNQWENFCVLNPGVIYDDEHNEFVMVYRAAGDDIKHLIQFGLAKSKDGIHFSRCYDKPVFAVDPDDADGGCVEDPRIVRIGRHYYMTYAARAFAPGRYWLPNFIEERSQWFPKQDEQCPVYYRTNQTVTYLALTDDFVHYRRLGRITDSREDDRDVVIFPRAINGKFVRISRPVINEERSMWISYSDDLIEWGERNRLYSSTEPWEGNRVGASCPPIEIEEGWLLVYHAVSNEDHRYRVGLMLLDKDNPSVILSKTREFVMEPDRPYEFAGLYDGCVFPTGAVLKDGTLYIYYGCADKHISVATASLEEILTELKKQENKIGGKNHE